MGIFDKIFGGKKQGQKTTNLEQNQLDEFIGEKTAIAAKELEKPVFSKISEIKYTLNEINAQLRQLKEKEVPLSEGNVRLRQVVRTSQSRLITHLGALAKKLEPPKTADMNAIMEYANNSAQLIPMEVVAARKSIVYTKTILDTEIKEIGKLVTELETGFTALAKMFKESPLQKNAHLKQRISTLQAYTEGTVLLKNSLLEKKHELKRLLAQKNEALEKLGELKNSPEATELNSLEQKITELDKKKQAVKEKFGTMLGEIEKPLTRFLKLVSAKKYVLPENERELLEQFVSDFFSAAKKDTKAQTLKKLLSEMQKLIEDGTISLKDKEKQTAAIKKIMEFDFFSEVFWELNAIEVRQNEIESHLKTYSITKKISGLEYETAVLSKEITEKQAQAATLSMKLLSQENSLLSLKETLEKELSAQFGGQITIQNSQ